MKRLLVAVFLLMVMNTLLFPQEALREQKLRQIADLNDQINKIVEELLQPSPADVKAAESEGVKVFRIMPREIYARRIIMPQEGGAFYSFTTGSHDYQKTSQILLEGNSLQTGFAGADYGLMADLGNLILLGVGPEIPEVNFLLKYKAPTNILDARVEQQKRGNYPVDNFVLRARLPVSVGHSYVLRAISFGRADVLVALKVMRKDTDGSLIIFWKPLAEFEKPELDPNIREK